MTFLCMFIGNLKVYQAEVTSFVNIHAVFNSPSFEAFRPYRPQPDVEPLEAAVCVYGTANVLYV